jgi:hypothetical protein
MAGMEERPIQMPEEWSGIVPTQVFVEEARRLVDEATKRDIALRLLGGVAIRIHSLDFFIFRQETCPAR